MSGNDIPESTTGETLSHETNTKPMDPQDRAEETDVDGETNMQYGTHGRCTAHARSAGRRCKRPAVGSHGKCDKHGGASTGPQDTSTLEGNDHAAGNPGGGAPEGNANAEIHGGFADWEKAYERFDTDTREWVDRLAADIRDTAAEHAPHVSADRRARLAREKATLLVLKRRAAADVWCDVDGTGPGRGLVVEREMEIDGETYTKQAVNPAARARHTHWNRTREIAKELRLWPGFRDD